MDILKVFSLCEGEHKINIIGTVENPLFHAKQIGKLLGIKNIRETLRKYNDDLKVVQDFDSLGGIQKVVFLTEKGLYRLLSRSNKPIAEKFQNWMIDVIKEIRLTGQYQLQKQNEIDKKLIQLQEKQKTHQKLIELFHLKNVVYICKMKDIDEDNKFIIKIGSSQDIRQRIPQLSIEYNLVPVLLDMFECISHIRLERNIHNNTSIKSLRHQIKKNDNTMSRETYIVNEEEYNILLQIIKKEIKKISTEEEAGKILELETKKVELEIKKVELETLNKKIQGSCVDDLHNKTISVNKELQKDTITQDICKEETNNIQERCGFAMQSSISHILRKPDGCSNIIENNKDIIPDLSNLKNAFIRNRATPRSPKVYQFDPNTKEIINIYDNIVTVLRTIDGTAITSLKSAVKNNSIYKGSRWLFVDKDTHEDPALPPTQDVRHQEVRLVAMIDIKQTKIVEVFDCQKNAALARNLEGFSTISRAIKTGGISSGHYWKWYEDCNQEMKEAYLANNTLPIKHINKNSTSVIKIHPLTNEELCIYNSITDVLVKYQMSRTTLKKISNSNEVYNGFKWRIVTE